MFLKIRNILYEDKREPFPDFLRGLAIMLMIQVHIIELLLISEPTYYLFEKWSYFFGGIPAAPVFILLMGYYQDKSTLKLSKELTRGVKILLLGLLLNILMNLTLLYKYLTNQIEIDIYRYIFGVDILIFAGLSYLLIAFIRRIIQKQIYWIVIILLIQFINLFQKDIVTNSEILKFTLAMFIRVGDWSYFPIIPWISFPLIGILLNRSKYFEKILAKKFPKYFWFVYLILIIITTDFGLKSSYNLDNYYRMNLALLIYSLFILFAWIKFSNSIYENFSNNLIINYLKWLGRNVTAVYFFQWIIIGNIATYLYKSLSLNSCLIVFVITIFSVTICTYLYQLSRS